MINKVDPLQVLLGACRTPMGALRAGHLYLLVRTLVQYVELKRYEYLTKARYRYSGSNVERVEMETRVHNLLSG